MKKPIVTGMTGQEGARLMELFLHKVYQAFGTYRSQSYAKFWRLNELGWDESPDVDAR